MTRQLSPFDRAMLEQAVKHGDIPQLLGRLTSLTNDILDATQRLNLGLDIIERMQKTEDQRGKFRPLEPALSAASLATESLLVALQRTLEFAADDPVRNGE